MALRPCHVDRSPRGRRTNRGAGCTGEWFHRCRRCLRRFADGGRSPPGRPCRGPRTELRSHPAHRLLDGPTAAHASRTTRRVQRRRARPARLHARSGLRHLGPRLRVLHAVGARCAWRLCQPCQRVRDDREPDRCGDRAGRDRQHLVRRWQSQRWRPRHRRRWVPVRLDRRRWKRPAWQLRIGRIKRRCTGSQPAQRQDPSARPPDRRPGAWQSPQRFGHCGVCKPREHPGNPHHLVSGAVCVGAAKPVPLRLRSQQRPLLHQRRRPEHTRRDQRGCCRRELRMECSGRTVPARSESAVRRPAARHHRSDRRLPALDRHIHHCGRFRAGRRVAEPARRWVRVRGWRPGHGVVAYGRRLDRLRLSDPDRRVRPRRHDVRDRADRHLPVLHAQRIERGAQVGRRGHATGSPDAASAGDRGGWCAGGCGCGGVERDGGVGEVGGVCDGVSVW